MELKEVDPWEVTVHPLNERQVGESDEEMVENVKKMGLIQPPIVQTLDGDGTEERMGAEFGAVVGGRRIDAAQKADLEKIPVVVMDEWDDGDALAASITENIDSFRRNVDENDRAAAIERLMKLNNWSRSKAAKELGVGNTTVRRWLEPLEWEGSSFSPEIDRNNIAGTGDIKTPEKEEKPSLSTMREVRQMTGERRKDGRKVATEESEQVLKKVQEEGLSQEDVREARKRVDTGEAESPKEAVEQIATEKNGATDGNMIVHTRTTFTDDYAEGIDHAAKSMGASKDQVVRTAVVTWLEDNGYL